MALLRNLTIRGKIISILLFVIGLELIISLSSLYFLDAIDTRISRMISVDVEKIKLASRVNSNLLEIFRGQKNLMLATSKDQVGKFKHHMVLYKAEIDESLPTLNVLASREERELIKAFNLNFSEFQKINDQLVAMVDLDWEAAGEASNAGLAGTLLNVKAVDLSIGRGRAAYDGASAALAELVKRTEVSLDETGNESERYIHLALLLLLAISALSIGVGLFAGVLAAKSISDNINSLVHVTNSIAGGDLNSRIEVDSRDETGVLASSISIMQGALLEARDAAFDRDWLKTGVARINDVMRGRNLVSDLCQQTLFEVAVYLGANVGALFLLDETTDGPLLKLAGGYAYANPSGLPDQFKPGEGLVGQAAIEKRQLILKDLPKDYIKVCSGLGDSCPECITVTPMISNDTMKGVMELGFLSPPSELQISYLEQVMPAIAINIENAMGREDLAKALAHSQALYEEIQQQQEELKVTNEELEEQTHQLSKSHERLRRQQEELEELNQELEEKNHHLERQKQAIEQTRQAVEEKAEQLAIASKYKSEFLANMSHELRTPLNSMLLLSRMLSSNTESNLSEEQVRSAEIIHSSGNDLLSLINEILDLAKIEAGRMEIHVEAVSVRDVAEDLLNGFKPLTDDKGLYLQITTEADCPEYIWTDRKRLDQILRNLVSNAVKFTEEGGIGVVFSHSREKRGRPADEFISISIRDTGPGVPPDKQGIIFEAFQQLEGGTSRKYGGTGLGLSISRQLANLLGGEIELISKEGEGATFTLRLPVRVKSVENAAAAPKISSEKFEREISPIPPVCISASSSRVVDDLARMGNEDKTILIIEDDPNFAELLMKMGREKGFKCLVAGTGEEGISLAGEYGPKGIILDLRLPGKDGWSVLEGLKENPETRHIPVHIMSVEDAGMEALRKGAIGFITKPVRKEDIDGALSRLEHMFCRQVKDLLIVEDDKNLRESVKKLIGNNDVHIEEAQSAKEAMLAMRSKRFDCMILDLGLPDMSGLEMLRLGAADEGTMIPPIIVYTGRELTQEEEMELRGYAESIIIKGVRSEERLFDEASLFLHRVVEKLPPMKRQIITNLLDTDLILRGKQVLIVDDDMRNVFALSAVLEEKGIKTIKAENGKKALELLEKHHQIDLVLMDIMMPVMDGYETMRRIREQDKFQKLPVIALTAKAMKQDRERCIASGASDYLSKPVDLDRLFSIMRVWLYR